MELNVHDIVMINSSEAVFFLTEKPAWVDDVLSNTPYVIVRRAPVIDGRIPVGVRGDKRSERIAGFINKSDIEKVIKPADIVGNLSSFSRMVELKKTLDQVSLIMKRLKVNWGIIGSIAYEIVTNKEVVNEKSDIDIIISSELTRGLAIRLLFQIKSLPIRVDITVEKSIGGYNLAEYLETESDKMLVKTINGPQLIGKKELT